MFGITTGYKWWHLDASFNARDTAGCWSDAKNAKRYTTERGAKSMATRITRSLGVICVACQLPTEPDGNIDGLIEG